MSYKFNDSELTKEKSLWEVYRLSRKIKPSRFQIAIVSIAVVLLVLNAFFMEEDVSVLMSDARAWAVTGFNFTITTLGFLIAGFTIFATLSKPKMMLAMMDHTDKETGLPTLKCNFFSFMKVFVVYIFCATIYLFAILFGQKGGFFSNAFGYFSCGVAMKVLMVKLSYVFFGGSFVYLLLVLRTFVFNIYAIVMNSLRWEYHQP